MPAGDRAGPRLSGPGKLTCPRPWAAGRHLCFHRDGDPVLHEAGARGVAVGQVEAAG